MSAFIFTYPFPPLVMCVLETSALISPNQLKRLGGTLGFCRNEIPVFAVCFVVALEQECEVYVITQKG